VNLDRADVFVVDAAFVGDHSDVEFVVPSDTYVVSIFAGIQRPDCNTIKSPSA
jgi:archaellum component FlaF (FlaF/FlaG flagellin family)